MHSIILDEAGELSSPKFLRMFFSFQPDWKHFINGDASNWINISHRFLHENK